MVQAVAPGSATGATVDTVERIVTASSPPTQVLPSHDRVTPTLVHEPGAARRRTTLRRRRHRPHRIRDRGPDQAVVEAVLAARPSLGADQASRRDRAAPLTDERGGGADRPGRHRQDLHPRHRPRRLRAAGSASSAPPRRPGPPSNSTAGAGIPARTLHRLLAAVERGTSAPTPHPARRRRSRHGRHPHPRTRRHPLVAGRRAGCCSSATTTSSLRSAPVAGSRTPPPTRPPSPSSPSTAANAPWEQSALAELRNGDVAAAVDAYLDHGRVVVTADPTRMIDDAIDRWLAALDAGQRPVLLAGSNDIVDRLNRAAIDRLIDRGVLAAPCGSRSARAVSASVTGSCCAATATANAPSTATGRRRQRPARTVVAIADGPARRAARPRRRRRRPRRPLPRPGRSDQPRLRPHHPPRPGRHLGPVDHRRRRRPLPRSRLHPPVPRHRRELARHHRPRTRRTHRAPDRPRPPRHRLTTPTNPEIHDDLTRRLSTSTPSSSPTASTPTSPASTPSPVAGLPELAAPPARRSWPASPPTARLSGDQLAAELAPLDHTARHARAGSGSPATGTTSAPSSTSTTVAGKVHVGFVSADGHDATHTFGWVDLRLLGPAAEPRTLTSAAQQTLARHRPTRPAGSDRIMAAERCVSFAIAPGDADRYAHAMARHLERHAYALAAHTAGLAHKNARHKTGRCVAGATAWGRHRARHRPPGEPNQNVPGSRRWP